MVVIFSYVFAVVITVALAIILYPIAALFWILGLFGNISNAMFKFTKKAISGLWKDIGDMSKTDVNNIVSVNTWTCSCGCKNTGRFCSSCGKEKEVPTYEYNVAANPNLPADNRAEVADTKINLNK